MRNSLCTLTMRASTAIALSNMRKTLGRITMPGLASMASTSASNSAPCARACPMECGIGRTDVP